MTERIFVDTNVLVYAYDRSERAKQARAFSLLDQLAGRSLGVLSTQVLSEFFVTVTRKIPAPLTIPQAEARIQNYLLSWSVVDLSSLIVLEAVRGVREHAFGYWDALIWSAARLNQIPLILSEDFSDGTVVEGVRFIDPFTATFNLEDWTA
jgi:predicted nucleic acid-binding protein